MTVFLRNQNCVKKNKKNRVHIFGVSLKSCNMYNEVADFLYLLHTCRKKE